MDLNVLRVFQQNMAEQCRCWPVIIFDKAGTAIGCAALCVFRTEILEIKSKVLLRWRDSVRHIFPNFLLMQVLFCGLPIPSGSTHIRIHPGVSVSAIVTELDKVMKHLAKTTKSRLTVFKELNDSSIELANALIKLGYVAGEIPPMHLLNANFKDFDTYCNSLKSRYRLQIQRSQKKLIAAGFEVLQGRGSEFFAKYFTPQVHQFYVAVQSRAEQKLELLPYNFFQELAANLGDQASLTLILLKGEICAFTFSITRGATHYNMYSGLNYALNNTGDLYFNLFYNDMDQAFRAGATCQHFGQTSDFFKSRLGTSTQKLKFFAYTRPSFFNPILHLLASIVFPKVKKVEPHDVFVNSNHINKPTAK